MQLMGKMKKWWFIISGILIIPGIVSLAIWGLKLGIDFKGGTLLEISFDNQNKVEAQQVKEALSQLNLSDLVVQNTGTKQILIRTEPLDKDSEQKLKSILNEKIGESRELRLETVGPTISKDLTNKAIIAIILASVAIVLYIAYAFRKVPKPANSWRFGVCSVLALIHDLLVVIGIYSILGHFFGFEVDALFLTALLTVMGFSVHDTIVVFDRIRENLQKFPSQDFETTVNNSVAQTLARSLNTSLTLILVLFAMAFLGGETIRHFIITLLIGVTVGTYSSIFNAAPLLVVWQNWAQKRQNKQN
ncbi:MAG: protein translocase subunit SecF [Patescibacteria group bacterium]|nr:protein translocase subunit SecF [Patescibacteria group bacterium]